MSLPDLTDASRGITVHKPKADIYTWLLLVALVAIIIACTFLGIELGRYGGDYRAAGARAADVLDRTVKAAGHLV